MRNHLAVIIGAAFALAMSGFSSTSAGDGAPGKQVGGPANTLWLPANEIPAIQVEAPAFVRPLVGLPMVLDTQRMRDLLATAPLENTVRGREAPIIVTLPTPDGGFQRFQAVESPVMAPALAARFPEIKTYFAVGIDDPAATCRFDMSPLGFRAQVLTPGGAWYIDPYSKGNDILYTTYTRAGYAKHVPQFNCLTKDPAQPPAAEQQPRLRLRGQFPPGISAGTDLRTYQLAVCTTREFTQFYGNDVATCLAGVVTIVNRITGIYEIDFAARLELVANNDQLIFTTTTPGYPFTAVSDPDVTNSQAQTKIDAVIGSANYDTGHTFHRGSNNGLAGGIGTVCQNGLKGEGYTSTDPPNGDLFAVDYAAHEVGHNFGGRHTFSNCSGGAGDSAAVAVEPGSASTIMGYAGICGAQNLQTFSDPYFNGINVGQVLTYLTGTGGPCAAVTSLSNTPPAIDAGADYTIPVSTPYVLTAVGSDVDLDPVTYCWEQQDGRSGTGIPITDPGSGPLTRSFSPVSDPSRTVPRLSVLVTNTTANNEIVPATAREMNWRVTARDGRGGVNTDDMIITVTTAGGAFSVTAPNTNTTLQGATTVTWNVAGTSGAPVNCANVQILLSTDGGFTYPTELAASTANDGSESVVLPNITTSTARVRVQAIGNIFFDISNVNFSIIPVVEGISFVSGGAPSSSDSTGNGNANGYNDPGESDIHVTLPVSNIGLTTATGVSGTITSLTATVSVVSDTKSYPDIVFGGTQSNTSGFVVAIAPEHPCGSPFTLRLNMNSNEGSGGPIDYVLSTGSPGGLGSPVTTSYTGPAVAIPDNNTTGITADLPVSGFMTNLGDINFRFDGTSCSSTSGSTTVGLNHTWVGDLIVTLTSPPPSNISVVIINRPGGGTFGSDGNNFCQTVLDDEGGGSAIQAITTAGAPYTGTFTPANGLAAFQGIDPNGTWKLKVVDAFTTDTGSLRSFSLIIRQTNNPVCTPPLAVTFPCCLTDGTCVMVSVQACIDANGAAGADTSCSPGLCPIACCFTDGTCSELDLAACDTAGGSPHLPDMLCSPNPCPLPTGACCDANGQCTAVTGADCAIASGTYLGDLTTCTANVCDGACCTGGTNCSLVANSAACTGHFGGAGVLCNVHPNHLTPCCHADFNGVNGVTVQDLFDFLAAYFAHLGTADFNAVGGVTVQDLFDFLKAWFAKC